MLRHPRTVQVSNDEVERRLKRALTGDPTRGERGVMNALRSDGIDEARRFMERDGKLGEDFRALVSEWVKGDSAEHAAATTWRVRVAPEVWKEYARESRETGITLSDCLSAAVARDHERRVQGRDPLDALTREVRAYHDAARQLLEEVRSLGIASSDVRGLIRRVARLEETQSGPRR